MEEEFCPKLHFILRGFSNLPEFRQLHIWWEQGCSDEQYWSDCCPVAQPLRPGSWSPGPCGGQEVRGQWSWGQEAGQHTQSQHHRWERDQSASNILQQPKVCSWYITQIFSYFSWLRSTPELLGSDRSDEDGDGGQNTRFKTEICRNFKEKGHCLYGDLCQFAHGKEVFPSTNYN